MAIGEFELILETEVGDSRITKDTLSSIQASSDADGCEITISET